MSGVEIFVVAVLLGLITAVIAQRKGHSFLHWWLFGAVIFIVALPTALLIKPNEETRRQCPLCRTWITVQARVCPQCGRDVYEYLARQS